MKHNILHILIMMLAGCLAACTDDLIPVDIEEGEEVEYTLQLEIDNSMMQSRGVTTVMQGGLKTTWCYGDKVTLSNGTSSYDFVIKVPDDKTAGDPVEGVATFSYRTQSVSDWTSFTGTITYEGESSKDDKIYSGCTGLSNLSTDYTRFIDSSRYAFQSANDNTDHLKCADCLSAKLNNVNLRNTTIVMRHDFSILKIVLDDIYYDLYGGSVLFVEGLKPLAGSTAQEIQGMVLGDGIVSDIIASDKYQVNTLKINRRQDPREDLGVEPFYTVSETKRPFTGYAERSEDHKLIVYMPIFEERQVAAGGKIRVYLRDSWSTDWYMWQTDPLTSFKLKGGNLYTLDFTKKIGDKHLYESVAGISLGHAHLYGIFGTKNLGAEKPTDVGDYYMFGESDPIVEGQHYPKYPNATPFYFYDDNYHSDGSGDCLAIYNRNGHVPERYAFLEPSSYGNGNAVLSRILYKSHSTTYLETIWRMWLPKLDEWPAFMGTWTLPPNANPATFKGLSTLLPSIIDQDGQETTDCTNPAGVRLRNIRTDHCIYLPVSGVLEPTSVLTDPKLLIDSEAVAQMKEGTETYALFTGQYFYLPPVDEGKDVKLICYVSNVGMAGAPKEKMYFSLYDAAPIRPALLERDINEILPYIPGWTGVAIH